VGLILLRGGERLRRSFERDNQKDFNGIGCLKFRPKACPDDVSCTHFSLENVPLRKISVYTVQFIVLQLCPLDI
jgi:hypothetical protein